MTGQKEPSAMNCLERIKPLYGVTDVTGCPEAEITAMKSRFGALPEVIEDFYQTAAKTEAFHFVQDNWILPEHYEKWAWLKETDALLLMSENQGVCFAGIRKEDLAKPDPPVYVTYEEDFSGWSLCAKSASEFLAAALTYEAVFSFAHLPEEMYWYTPEEAEKVRAGLTKLPFELLNWCSETHITLYQNAPDNLLVLLGWDDEEDETGEGGEYQALYGAVTEESYQRLIAVLGGLGEPV